MMFLFLVFALFSVVLLIVYVDSSLLLMCFSSNLLISSYSSCFLLCMSKIVFSLRIARLPQYVPHHLLVESELGREQWSLSKPLPQRLAMPSQPMRLEKKRSLFCWVSARQPCRSHPATMTAGGCRWCQAQELLGGPR